MTRKQCKECHRDAWDGADLCFDCQDRKLRKFRCKEHGAARQKVGDTDGAYRRGVTRLEGDVEQLLDRQEDNNQ